MGMVESRGGCGARTNTVALTVSPFLSFLLSLLLSLFLSFFLSRLSFLFFLFFFFPFFLSFFLCFCLFFSSLLFSLSCSCCYFLGIRAWKAKPGSPRTSRFLCRLPAITKSSQARRRMTRQRYCCHINMKDRSHTVTTAITRGLRCACETVCIRNVIHTKSSCRRLLCRCMHFFKLKHSQLRIQILLILILSASLNFEFDD